MPVNRYRLFLRIEFSEMNGTTKSLLAAALSLVFLVSIWGILDPEGAVEVSRTIVDATFNGRGWFIMLSVSGMLFLCLSLAVSRFGSVRLGADDDRPEFSTATWLSMLISAGMGVGILFWAVAEPMSHFVFGRTFLSDPDAATQAVTTTVFHWGLHAWAIYATTALCIAYFAFRRQVPMMIGAPIRHLFPNERWAQIVAWFSDFFAIAAIAIGVGGSMAMGVFQLTAGVEKLLPDAVSKTTLTMIVFVAVVACYLPPLMVDLDAGLSKLSKLAMTLASALLVFLVLFGPTQFLMNSVISSFGTYLSEVIPRGFQTFTFYDDALGRWFKDWTLTYMVWWIAWGPFVGVFIARISKGRTIREFVFGVLFVPTLFSVLWFGSFGGIGVFDTLHGDGNLETAVSENLETVTFDLLALLPLSTLTISTTVIAAFIFVVITIVSAAFVLSTFSIGGIPEPSSGIRLTWGVLLALLGAGMVLSGSIEAVRSLIVLGALPFVFILLLLATCLARALKEEN